MVMAQRGLPAIDKFRDEHIAHCRGRGYEGHANESETTDAYTAGGLAHGRITRSGNTSVASGLGARLLQRGAAEIEPAMQALRIYGRGGPDDGSGCTFDRVDGRRCGHQQGKGEGGGLQGQGRIHCASQCGSCSGAAIVGAIAEGFVPKKCV